MARFDNVRRLIAVEAIVLGSLLAGCSAGHDAGPPDGADPVDGVNGARDGSAEGLVPLDGSRAPDGQVGGPVDANPGTPAEVLIRATDHGALCNGSHDDTAAIQAAIVAAAAPKATVTLPAGTCLVTRPLLLRNFVKVRGQGMASTTLTAPASVITAASSPFSQNYIFDLRYGGEASDCVISDLRIDGQYRNGPKSGAYQVLGGIHPGDRWVIERVHFYDVNYFGVFVDHGNDVLIQDSQSSLGTVQDGIGGGSNIHGLTVLRHRWNADYNSQTSALDLVNASNVTVKDCVNDSLDESFYVEAWTDSLLQGNTFNGKGGIDVQSDSGYGANPVTMSARVTISGNRLLGGGHIFVRWSAGNNLSPALPTNKGGGIRITGNTVENAQHLAIFWGLENDTNSTGGGSIADNTVTNPNTAQNDYIDTDQGRSEPTGITATSGLNLRIDRNLLRETRTGGDREMEYGIQVGRKDGVSVNGQVRLSQNVIEGAYGAPYIFGTVTPAPILE